MKKKKSALFSLPVLLSFFVIVLISLIIPNFPNLLNPPTLNPSLSSSSNFSFRDLLPQPPTTHNSKLITLTAVGDIMLGRYCNVQMLKNKDWRYPFLKTDGVISAADITFGNLEAPVVENCPTTETGMVFCARPEAIEGLKLAGFDILSLANNHILNYGQKGLDYTQKLLSSSNILYSPLTSSKDPDTPNSLYPTKLVKNGLSFGFLAFDLVTYPQLSLIPSPRFAGEAGLISQISLISPTVDILIVSLHWGNEYQKEPTKNQKELARQIIDAGAKVVIGHHPHVTQPGEKYKNGLIFYSLGNFVFDQSWSEETKKGEIAKIIFEGKEIKSYEIIPIYIENYCQPRLLN